jgi:hypothetical protein
MKTAPQQATDVQMQDPLFRCGECAEPVVVFNGRFFRTCDHLTADILATPEAAKAVTNANN